MSDYAGEHRPSPEGATMDRAREAFPSIDVMPHIYAYGPEDTDSIATINAAAGLARRSVIIYRAVPPGVTQINSGDWVTISESYAQQHAMQDGDPAHDWPVLREVCRANELRTDGDSVNEWGYFPT